MNRFKLFLKEDIYVELEASNISELKDNRLLYEIVGFIKIVENTNNKTKILYDIRAIRNSINELINKDANRMFIDLEFTMPEYGEHGSFMSEIIQFGYIIEDKDGNELDKNNALIKPINTNISNRTLEFINRTIDEFDDAIPKKDFYKILKEAIKNEIKQKDKDLTGQMITEGTTPRVLTDLIGSLCDLTSGSGDKGTPVIFIQGYFDNLADD